MRIFCIFTVLLALLACQPDQNESKEPVASEAPSKDLPAKFSMLLEQPYDIIESDEVCTEPVVIEFFAYHCPHCLKLEKFAQAWKKKNAGKVKFLTVPTHLGHQEFGPFLIVHQAAKDLGILEKATAMLFKRFHEDKKSFTSPEEAIAFLVSAGADETQAKKAITDEETTKTGLDENFRLLAKYKISSVPTILVNHRYQFDVTKAGGYEKVFEIVEETLKLPSNCSTKK